MQDPGKCRCITFLSHIMKLLERTLDARIRKRVEQELGEEQQGFRKGKGTTDGMFALIRTAGREEVGDARENGSGICIPSQVDCVCRRFGHNSREQTRTTGSVGRMEGGVQEARTCVGHQREELTISFDDKEI